MITDREVFKVEGNTKGERVAMGVQAADMTHIMGLLTDAYSDKPLAVIREYSTNARDAHVEQGNPDVPIEITLPSDFAPFFRVKDHGVGLTAEDIRTIYAQYGASTKRGTNDQNGTFGIGCKAALSYCSQFTVTSVKEGRKVVVNVSRDEDGSGYMELISDDETDQSNGTEVTVPVSRDDIYTFTHKAEQFYEVWEPGTVLVNGEKPQHHTANPGVLKLDDNLFVLKHRSDARIVMGNVAYPVPQLLNAVGGNLGLLAFVDIGAVTIPHSREALQDAKNTTATINSVRERAVDLFVKQIQAEIESAPSHPEALKVYRQWRDHIPVSMRDKMQYKGSAIPTYYRLPGYDDNLWESHPNQPKFIASSLNSWDRAGNSSPRAVIQQQTIPNALWILGYEPKKFTANHKKKFLQLVNRVSPEMVQLSGVLVCVPDDQKWKPDAFTAPERIFKWEDVKAEKLPRTDGASGRLPGSYDIFTETGTWQLGISGDDIRKDKPVFWCRGSWRDNRNVANSVIDFFGLNEFTVVALTDNRVAKFQRNVPKARELRAAIRDEYEAWAKSITRDERKALYMRDNGWVTTLENLDAGKINDPALRTAVRLAKIDVSGVKERHTQFSRFIGLSLGELIGNDLTMSSPFKKYPLMRRGLDPSQLEHLYLYVNAVYAAGI